LVHVKYDLLPLAGFQMPLRDRASRMQAELAYIQPLSAAYKRALAVTKAFERAHDQGPELARIEIWGAYEKSDWDVSARDLIAIAMMADTNPLPLWPAVDQNDGPSFEVLRFIGQVQRGATAVLLPAYLDVVREALAVDEHKRALIQQIVIEVLRGFFDQRTFNACVATAEKFGKSLVVMRRTRELATGEAVAGPIRGASQLADSTY
jgi:hypothetical protein